MARTAIQPADMADPRPRYTHGWRVGNTVYVAGQLALDKAGKLVGPNDIAAQTRQVFENIKRVLEGGGATLQHVVKLTVFVTEKDAVKCAPLAGPDTWVVPVEARLPAEFPDRLHEQLHAIRKADA